MNLKEQAISEFLEKVAEENKTIFTSTCDILDIYYSVREEEYYYIINTEKLLSYDEEDNSWLDSKAVLSGVIYEVNTWYKKVYGKEVKPLEVGVFENLIDEPSLMCSKTLDVLIAKINLLRSLF